MIRQTTIAFAAVLLATAIQAQQRTTGIVLDYEEKPVAGANVSVKGTTQSTITDIDGYFEISTKNGDVLQINLPQQKTKFFSADRFALWVDGGMTTPSAVWGYNPHTGEYSIAGGGVGFGYQCYNRGFLFETGVEFRSLNYMKGHRLYYGNDKEICDLYYVNSGFVQVPLLIGFEVTNFYMLIGGKVGSQLYNLYNAKATEYKHLRAGPALELGWNFDQGISAAKLQKSQRGWSQEGFTVNYKVAFIFETGFEFDFVNGVADDWTNTIAGAKFTVAFQNKVKQKY